MKSLFPDFSSSRDLFSKKGHFLFSSMQRQSLSSNGEVQSQHPQGQKYVAYVRNSGNHAKEHAFRILNIDTDNDSGVYECLVKYKDEVVDHKKQIVTVVTEEPPPPTHSYSNLPSSKKSIEPKTLPRNLMCHEERQAKNIDRGLCLWYLFVLYT